MSRYVLDTFDKIVCGHINKPLDLSIQIIVPKLGPLTDQQIARINKLRLSSQQAEDALSLGLEKLQQSLVQNIAIDPLVVGNSGSQMAVAMEKIEALEGFLNQVMQHHILGPLWICSYFQI